MSSDNSNQSAFPFYSKVFEVSQTPGFAKNYKQITSFDVEGGLTKQEYFAAMAMQGLVASGNWENEEQVCKKGIKIADELLKQLSP